MNFILRKSTNQLSKNRYEKHRIEHRGGTHDIVDYDGHGNFNTFGDARNYTVEEQVATGTWCSISFSYSIHCHFPVASTRNSTTRTSRKLEQTQVLRTIDRITKDSVESSIVLMLSCWKIW